MGPRDTCCWSLLPAASLRGRNPTHFFYRRETEAHEVTCLWPRHPISVQCAWNLREGSVQKGLAGGGDIWARLHRLGGSVGKWEKYQGERKLANEKMQVWAPRLTPVRLEAPSSVAWKV